MPKVEIDYSNTIIYKITCKDPSLTDVYVGHTTNFVQRKHAHKQSCNNHKSTNHNCKLYKVIRNNGGWQNWIMEIVNFFNCHDHYEARKKEQEYFILLHATLNSIEPMPKPKQKNVVIKCNLKTNPTCDVSNTIFGNDKLYEEDVKKSQKSLYKFSCDGCHYFTSRKSQYDRHLLTSKHQNETNETSLEQTENQELKKYVCVCSKECNSRSTLWRHKKNCKHHQPLLKDDQIDISTLDMNLIMQLLKQNDEFKSLMVEQNNKMMETFQEVCKNGGFSFKTL
jgi:hypothetical protein